MIDTKLDITKFMNTSKTPSHSAAQWDIKNIIVEEEQHNKQHSSNPEQKRIAILILISTQEQF